MKYFKNTIAKILFVFLVTIISFSANGQNLTKIKDATVSGTSAVAKDGAILELESNNKGLLVPRMTTGQRDAIGVANRSDGLLIYNTTTGCFNHWSAAQSVWLSICGTPPPADFSISAAQCNAILANGTYTQGGTLTTANYLTIPVTVTQAGNYGISATTANGYYFEKNGNFPTAGNYTLNLQGTGTPNNATATPGDVVTIALNGITNSCNANIPIVPSAVSYTINCGTAAVSGVYNIGIPLTTKNKMTLNVTVTSLGFWSINSGAAPINGMKFSGTGTFTALGPQTIEIPGSGTPTASGSNNFPLISNAVPSASCAGIPVTVAPVGYAMDCNAITVNGGYMQDVTLNSANTITLPVNVTATGTTTVTTNTVNGMAFSSGAINLTTLGTQNITLLGRGTATGAGPASFTITGTGASASCTKTITVAPQPVAYTLNCSSVTVNGIYRPNVALGSSNTITMTVNASYGGAYRISTNTVDGISFSVTGTLTVGSNAITLQGTGTPASAGKKIFIISSNSTSGTSTCSASLEVFYRPMVIVGIGIGTYQPGSAGSDQTSKAVLVSEANFGTLSTSKVKVPKFVMAATTTATTSALIDGATPNATQLSNYINTSKADILVIGYSWAPDAATRAVLVDFIKNKKGAVLNFSENNSASLELPRELYNLSTISNTSRNGAGALYPFAAINDPVLNGVFGDVRGLNWGEDASGTDHLSNLPGNVIVYSNGNPAMGTAGVTSFRDASLGYLWVGDGGFTSGDRTNSSDVIWPAKNDASSNPIAKLAYGTSAYGGPKSVYNSIFYANALAWAISYVQQNKP